MILETNMWIVRHKSGRYLKSDVRGIGRGSMGYEFFYWLVADPFSGDAVYSPKPWESMFAERNEPRDAWAPYGGWHLVADQFDVVNRPGCKCCGETERRLHFEGERIYYDHPSIRCDKHKNRNPCAIEGCARTKPADGFSLRTDQWLCPEHWRRFCPPRSARRRAYHSYFRKAKRLGDWTPELRKQFYRFWDTLIASARARHAAGVSIDQDEINKLFGWDDA